jgi:hypothetical protein
MLLDPGVGFLEVHEFASLAPRPQTARRKVQLPRPFRRPEFIDGHAPEKIWIAPRVKDFSAAIQQWGQIDLGRKAVREGDRDPIPIQWPNRSDFLQKVVRLHFIQDP